MVGEPEGIWMQPRLRPYEDWDLGAGRSPLDAGVGAHLRFAVACAAPDRRVSVAEQEGSLVGFVAVELHFEARMGEIHMLAVDPDHQRRGIGSARTEFALDWIKSTGMPVAMVETGATPATPPHVAPTKVWASRCCPSPASSRSCSAGTVKRGIS